MITLTLRIKMTTKEKLSFEDACFQWASGFYLTSHLSDNWFKLDEDKQDQFLEHHLWEPFEYYSARMISKEISSLARWIELGDYPKKEEYETV
tara:strand:+ start:301 stop:579 length:279 start_codon:yes stop_codon:yes gene_type:complete